MTALELRKKGYGKVFVVLGGWREMLKAGFPYISGGKITSIADKKR